jgi:hypothetical protein
MSNQSAQLKTLKAKHVATTDAERISLVLVCTIIFLVTAGLFVWGPTVELSAGQIDAVVLWGP